MTRSENPFVRLVPSPAPPSLPPANPFRPTSTDPRTEAWVSPPQASAAEEMRIQALAEEARAVKAEMDQAQERYDQVKAALWKAVGEQPVKKDRYGFSFRAPQASRRVDYKRLADFWPDVYAQVVTKTEPKDDAVGSLYL